jgi:hypothetical protein
VVKVTKSSRIDGRDRIDLRVDSIAVNGKSYPVVTTMAASRGGGKGARTLRRTGVGAGAGAWIGGIAGGGTGAAIGALVGGGAGTAVAHLTIPPETYALFPAPFPLENEVEGVNERTRLRNQRKPEAR